MPECMFGKNLLGVGTLMGERLTVDGVIGHMGEGGGRSIKWKNLPTGGTGGLRLCKVLG